MFLHDHLGIAAIAPVVNGRLLGMPTGSKTDLPCQVHHNSVSISRLCPATREPSMSF
jgi:hypothetical protein